MAVAKAKGRLRGKQPKLSKKQEAHLVSVHRAGKHTTVELAELFAVARSTVYRGCCGARHRPDPGPHRRGQGRRRAGRRRRLPARGRDDHRAGRRHVEPLPDHGRGHQDRLQGLHHRHLQTLLLRLRHGRSTRQETSGPPPSAGTPHQKPALAAALYGLWRSRPKPAPGKTQPSQGRAPRRRQENRRSVQAFRALESARQL